MTAKWSTAPLDQPLNKPGRIRLAIVTNIPAPYRVPIFNCLAADPTIDLQVFYCARREPDRAWDLPDLMHPYCFLKEAVFIRKSGRFSHNNPDVFPAIKRFDPQVVLTTGFNLTHLYAFAYSQIHRRPHIVMTDGTVKSELYLSWPQRLTRRLVMARSRSFVAASSGGRALLRGYGAADDKIYISPLCANVAVNWKNVEPFDSRFDFIFSGRLANEKNPIFALQVIKGVAERLGRRMSVAVLGTGALQFAVRDFAMDIADQVDVHLAGHVSQSEVPRWFSSARVFLFPTSWDPWGVVANEACLAGLPVIVSPYAGVAGELILDGVNGYVRPLELPQWVDAAVRLISDPRVYEAQAAQSRRQVAPYSVDNAARGIADAVRRAAQ